MPPRQPPAGNPMLVPWVLYGALFAATCMYLLVLWMQAPYLADLEPDEVLLPTLTAAALGLGVGSFFVPRFLHQGAIRAMKLETVEAPDPNVSVMLRDEAPKIRVFAKPDAARRRARAVFFTSFIVRLAMAEAISIFGFLLGMQGFGWLQILPFWGLCWVIFAANPPLASRIFGPVEQALGARFPD